MSHWAGRPATRRESGLSYRARSLPVVCPLRLFVTFAPRRRRWRRGAGLHCRFGGPLRCPFRPTHSLPLTALRFNTQGRHGRNKSDRSSNSLLDSSEAFSDCFSIISVFSLHVFLQLQCVSIFFVAVSIPWSAVASSISIRHLHTTGLHR